MTTDAVQPWSDVDRIREAADRLKHLDLVERYEDPPRPHGPAIDWRPAGYQAIGGRPARQRGLPPHGPALRPERTPRGFFDWLRRVPPHGGRSKKNAARKGDGGP